VDGPWLDAAAFAFGTAIGAVGTMVGVGGGFLIVPVVAMVQPHWETRTVTAFSLAVVCANACSGTLAYLRQRRVDIRSAIVFAAAAAPGAVIGVAGANALQRRLFDQIFAVVLAVMAGWLMMGPQRKTGEGAGTQRREIVDRMGNRYVWSFRLRWGIAGSIAIGILSALLGIGGGPVQVPFLVTALNYPEHVATATSHAVLAVTSLVATVVHVAQGDYRDDAVLTLCTAAGALCGAPLGARLSRFVSGRTLMQILAVMLGLLAARLAFQPGRGRL